MTRAGCGAGRTAGHLVRRFLGSLRPGPPEPAAAAWARGHLLPGEATLFSRMSGPDQRHAVGVARRVEAELGERAARPVLAAALLHDVGKVDSGLGTLARVAATVVGLAGGRARAATWSTRGGWIGRLGRYLRHPQIGADLLAAAGSDSLTVAWSRDHHLPPERWDPAVPPEVARALKACDDD